VFIAGPTGASDYPVTEEAYDTTYNGSVDIIVSKLDSDLTSLLSSTFIGGTAADYADALAIDSSGNVFVAGHTISSDYPTTEGAFDTTYSEQGNNNYDVIVSKLDNNLGTLLSSTFIGGGSHDSAKALATDSSGNVFVAGHTISSDYPTTEGAFDTTYNSGGDVFVSKLDGSLSSLLSSTFIGGTAADYAKALATDFSGNVLVAGVDSVN